MKLKAKTEIAKQLLKGKDYIELNNNSYYPLELVNLWCFETKNDFKTNFELIKS